MMCWHDWTKWESKIIPVASGGAIEFQHRECKKCGYKQRESL